MDEVFINFLAETVHPVVRPDREEAARLATQYNDQLRMDGWILEEVELIAGRPRYEGQQIRGINSSMVQAKKAADSLEAGWMHREILRIEHAVESDPDLAIGTSKELVETCCKTILGKLGEEVPRNVEFSDLVKRTVKALKITRDDIPDSARGADIIRTVLSNLTAIPRGMNELRNLYGTGHGRDGGHKGLEPRHARLAASSAIAFVTFISDTYRDKHKKT